LVEFLMRDQVAFGIVLREVNLNDLRVVGDDMQAGQHEPMLHINDDARAGHGIRFRWDLRLVGSAALRSERPLSSGCALGAKRVFAALGPKRSLGAKLPKSALCADRALCSKRSAGSAADDAGTTAFSLIEDYGVANVAVDVVDILAFAPARAAGEFFPRL